MKVSILLQTYNQAGYLRKAVESLLAQTHADFELVVVDDCSSDATPQVLAGYAGQERVSLIRNSRNLGQHASTNLHLPRLGGEYVVFASGDDVYYPVLLERQLTLFAQQSGAGFVHVNGHVLSPEGQREGLISERYVGRARDLLARDYHLGGRDLLRFLLCGNVVASHSTVMVRRESLDRAGCFDEGLPQVGDWDMWMRLCANDDAAYSAEPLVGWRRHSSSASVSMHQSGVTFEDYLRLARKLIREYPEPTRAMAHSEPYVLRWGFLEPAWFFYVSGRPAEAQARLLEGFSAFEGAGADPALVRDSLVYWLHNESPLKDDLAKTLAAIDLIGRNMPHHPLTDMISGKQVKAQFLTVEAFQAYAERQAGRTAGRAVRAILADPACLRNRGLLSILSQSLIGPANWRRLHGRRPQAGTRL